MDLSKWENKFNTCLALEFSNPEYFKVHHILVPAYHLQSRKYAPEIQSSVIKLLAYFLAHPDVPPSHSQIEEINKRFSSNKREVHILAKGTVGVIPSEMTILNVRTDTAQHYCQDVVAWAHSVLSELELSNK